MTTHALFLSAAVVFAIYAALALVATFRYRTRIRAASRIDAVRHCSTPTAPYNDVDDIYFPSSL